MRDTVITLGMKVVHPITGYRGTVIAKTMYLHGSTIFCVQPHGLHERSTVESEWFDVDALEELTE
jgi:hypothetical protein